MPRQKDQANHEILQFLSHKLTEYKLFVPPPLGWSGDTLVPPWTHPIPVADPTSPLFNQAGLSTSLAGAAFTRRKRMTGVAPGTS